MTDYYELADVTGVANRVTDNTQADTLVIKQGGVIGTTADSYLFSGGDLTATIAGIVNASGFGMAVRTGAYVSGGGDTGGSSQVSITETGALSGYSGLRMYGGNNIANNAGLISARGTALFMAGSGNSILNTGTIASFAGAGINSFLDQTAASIAIVNTGAISSFSTAIIANGSLQLENTGTIVGGGSYGVLGLNTSNIVNSGIIRATDASGKALGFLTASAVSIVNQSGGEITGTTAIRQTGSGVLTIVNEGRITGQISMGSGNDIYDGTLGTAGAIIGNGGDDAIAGGNGRELIAGGNGNDDLDGGGGNDAFVATDNDGDDIYDGGAGIDRISFAGLSSGGVAVDIAGQSAGGISPGNIGNDTILNIEQVIGTDFIDSLFGDSSVNQLYGGGDKDTLVGFDGNDRLFGQAGADAIIGGQGRDYLTGGDDLDTFRYQAVTDSSFGSATRDLILDFVSDADVVANPLLTADVIGLSQIDANTTIAGDQAFTFIGYANSPAAPPLFTGVAGQLRTYTNAAGATFAEGDVNGDSIADIQIQIFGVHTMAASDFVL